MCYSSGDNKLSVDEGVEPETLESSTKIVGRTPGADILTPGRNFSSSELYGSRRTFGGEIPDDERVFASKREPVLKWLVSYVASDIYDNGFKVFEVGKEEDEALDDLVQAELLKLGAKKKLTRLTVFERRWGTAILLLAYSTTDDDVDWGKPLYNENGKISEGSELLQITPYAKTSINEIEEDKEPTSLRYGLPEYYKITRGGSTSSLKVHWTRVIHDAPRIDEHPYLGESVMDPLWDDATGWRNIRWSFYQMLWRYGMGYPHFKFEGATQANIDEWVNEGGLTDFFVRGVFLSNEKTEVNFVGLEGKTVNPKEYVDMAYESMATASRISQDLLKGVSAGAVTGSEVNLREYAKLISNEQSDVEGVPIELVRRLMETGQIPHNYEEKPFKLEWNEAFIMNEIDTARVALQTSMARKNETEYLTLDEVRERDGVEPLKENGDLVLGIERLKKPEPKEVVEEPEE